VHEGRKLMLLQFSLLHFDSCFDTEPDEMRDAMRDAKDATTLHTYSHSGTNRDGGAVFNSAP
jgi:hypothetical protein